MGPDGKSFAFAVRQFGASQPQADVGLWVQTSTGIRTQAFQGWVVWFVWNRNGELLVLEGKPSTKGVLWRVDPGGSRRAVVLEMVPLFLRHTDVAIPIRFDVHPDGRRIAIEALESYDADIGMIDNVR